jgi:hypothetical protein
MPSSRISHRATLVRTDVSEDRVASIIRVARIGELGTLAITSNRSTLPHGDTSDNGDSTNISATADVTIVHRTQTTHSARAIIPSE